MPEISLRSQILSELSDPPPIGSEHLNHSRNNVYGTVQKFESGMIWTAKRSESKVHIRKSLDQKPHVQGVDPSYCLAEGTQAIG
jgi:hypothetical protein